MKNGLIMETSQNPEMISCDCQLSSYEINGKIFEPKWVIFLIARNLSGSIECIEGDPPLVTISVDRTALHSVLERI